MHMPYTANKLHVTVALLYEAFLLPLHTADDSVRRWFARLIVHVTHHFRCYRLMRHFYLSVVCVHTILVEGVLKAFFVCLCEERPAPTYDMQRAFPL